MIKTKTGEKQFFKKHLKLLKKSKYYNEYNHTEGFNPQKGKKKSQL